MTSAWNAARRQISSFNQFGARVKWWFVIWVAAVAVGGTATVARADGENPYSITITLLSGGSGIHVDFSNAPYYPGITNVYIDWDEYGQPNNYEEGTDFSADDWEFHTNFGLSSGTHYIYISTPDHFNGTDYWYYELVVP